jgi:hypothetical protein
MKKELEIVKIHQTPWILKDNGVLKSETILHLNTSLEYCMITARILVPGQPVYSQTVGPIAYGRSEIRLLVPELIRDNDIVTFSLFAWDENIERELASISLPQKKIRHWKIYVAHDMHLDIGYTDYQEDLIHTLFPEYLDEVLEEIDYTKEWEKDNQLKYPVEASYLLYGSALAARNADWIEKLKENLKFKRMNYPYNYLHFATEGMGTEQIVRQNYYSARFLNDILGTPPAKFAVHTDDAGFSWSHVDALTSAGQKYLSFRLQDSNWNYEDGHCPKYPRLFYLRGRTPESKLLTFDGPVYHFDDFGFRESTLDITIKRITDLFLDRQTKDYPYDSYLIHLTKVRDNSGIEPNVMHNIEALNTRADDKGRPYVFPHFINSLVEDFFEDIETHYKDIIPSVQGTLESFWSFGAAQVSYETSVSKENHENVPVAEFFSTIASALVPAHPYPYTDLFRAYDDMMLTDEHNWASWKYYVDDEQLKWSRNKVLEPQRIARRLLDTSFTALESLIPTEGPTLLVYNNSAWERTDLVSIESEAFPHTFEIIDSYTGISLPWQKTSNGSICFIASQVPQYGYKAFRIIPDSTPAKSNKTVTVTGNVIENDYYKITLDTSGCICSCIDKQNNNKELVDPAAPHKMNQFVYYTSKNELYDNVIYTEDEISNATISSETGFVMGMLVANGRTRGVEKVVRKVILYADLPRIDIINEVFKADAPPNYTECAEEGFFTFPFNMDNFRIAHDTPAGEIEPYVNSDIYRPTHQLYWSNTDFYVVNHWINVQGDKDNILFTSVNAPLVQYGGRRTCHWDKNYQIKYPWIYNWVFNNFWKTNFTYTQPGPVTYKYSITTQKACDWKQAHADKFGFDITNPLKSHLICHAQTGLLPHDIHSFFKINRDNVIATSVKMAESNGSGLIMRFHETQGFECSVCVDISGLPSNAHIIETDVIENDIAPIPSCEGMFEFSIPAYGWKTFRLLQMEDCPAPNIADACITEDGTIVKWTLPNEYSHLCYALYRGTSKDFIPGTGNYLATIDNPYYYDRQVIHNLMNDYYYKVQAIGLDVKSEFSFSAKACPGSITSFPPTIPGYPMGEAFGNYRISLSWEASIDYNDMLKGYRIYRNGVACKDIPSSMTSWMDVGLCRNTDYAYEITAFNGVGLESAKSQKIAVCTTNYNYIGDIAPIAHITASSERGLDSTVANISNGVCGMIDQDNWLPKETDTLPWIRMEWEESHTIDTIYLQGRYGEPFTCSGILTLNDGTCFSFSSLRTDGSATKLYIGKHSIDNLEIKFYLWDIQGGISEIQLINENSDSI